MSYLKSINPESLGAPQGYSNGMLALPGGRLLCVAGQIAWDSEQRLVGKTFADQFHKALTNVLTVVREAGGHAEHVAQLTIYVTDKSEYLEQVEAVGAKYRSVLGRHFPAMALIEISSLLDPGAKVEIQALAVLPAQAEALDVP